MNGSDWDCSGDSSGAIWWGCDCGGGVGYAKPKKKMSVAKACQRATMWHPMAQIL